MNVLNKHISIQAIVKLPGPFTTLYNLKRPSFPKTTLFA